MKNVLLDQLLFCWSQIQLSHFMRKNIPGLFPIGLILFKFLVLTFNIGFCRFGSVFHAFGYLSSIATCSTIRLFLCRILLLRWLAISSTGLSVCFSLRCPWLCWLLALCHIFVCVTHTWLWLLLLHLFIFLVNYYNYYELLNRLIFLN